MLAYHRFGLWYRHRKEESFDGIDVSRGIAIGRKRRAAFWRPDARQCAVEEAISKYSAQQPEATAPALARGLTATASLLDAVAKSTLSEEAKYNIRHELQIKRVQFNDALAEALGLSVSANVAPDVESDSPFRMDPDTFRVAIPGQKFVVKVRTVNQTAAPVMLHAVTVEPSSRKEQWSISPEKPVAAASIADGKPVDTRFRVTVPETAAFTRPYFSRPDIERSYYDIADDQLRNQPLAPYPLAAWADFGYRRTDSHRQVRQTTRG